MGGVEVKYVVIAQDGFESAVLVPDSLIHKLATHPDVMEKLKLKVVSAGFCEVKDGRVKCYGESTTLGLHARKEDAAVVEQTLWLNKMKAPPAAGMTNDEGQSSKEIRSTAPVTCMVAWRAKQEVQT